MTNNSDFLNALSLGQQKLLQNSTVFDEIVGVLDRFGVALSAFSEGRLGVGCVTRDGHEPIDDHFKIGVPMSVVVTLHEDKERPMPIVGGFFVPESGFPVEVTITDRIYKANDEGSLEKAFMELASSREMAAAVFDLLNASPSSANLIGSGA